MTAITSDHPDTAMPRGFVFVNGLKSAEGFIEPVSLFVDYSIKKVRIQ